MQHLRSYTAEGTTRSPVTICEAALATSAATSFFDPVQIGARQYVDGAFRANNPVYDVEEEATDIWCPESGSLKRLVKCFISIGTGNPGLKSIPDRVDKFARETLLGIATDTEAVAKKFMKQWRLQYNLDRYFRFNVEQGLQDVGLEEYQKQGKIEAATEEYLGDQVQVSKLRQCVGNLKDKQSLCHVQFA